VGSGSFSHGIYLAHKLAGVSSFSIVRHVQGQLAADPSRRPLKVCHGGTLDPFATGLLLVLVGRATRLFPFLHDVPKVYEATIRWGAETDSGDGLGSVRGCLGVGPESASAVEAAMCRFVGWTDQTPPQASAKRVGRERAYEKFRRGEEFELPRERVYLHRAQWLEHDLPRRSRLRITVRGGFYVRSLVQDLGREVGCGAHVAELRRCSIAGWNDPGGEQLVPAPAETILDWLGHRELDDDEAAMLRQGRTIGKQSVEPPSRELEPGFPYDHSLVRGMRRGRLEFVLREEGETLCALASLGRGIG
jgi:tRNA pseudouridine55 synthase